MEIFAQIKSWVPFQRSVATTSVDSTIAADTPIDRAEQDLLTRTAMARRIAQILAASGKTDGRVFAIRGAWGFGKSSLKNLVIEVLAARHPDVPVLDFNPWQWGDKIPLPVRSSSKWRGSLGGATLRLRQSGRNGCANMAG